jgi:predicted dithiol-disulfide oxidoreductase (DUF899 family)
MPPRNEEIAAIEKEILRLKKTLVEARRRVAPEVIPDLPLLARDGKPIRLSDCFGGRHELLAIHNMGSRCPYCTLWADGFKGFWPHLNDRCAFVLVSEDPPAAADAFARARNWPFPIVSMFGSEFANVLGVGYEGTHQQPGVSAFRRREDGSIVRTGHADFFPDDDFCSVWPLFELFEQGPNGWQPRFEYENACACCSAAKSS